MDNLLIFFDNTTFKINNIILNYLKRLIVYEIIYKKIYKNEINDVYIFKTKPSLIEYKISENNNIEIIKLLNIINNVIYKEYNSYDSLCFKNILDKIEEFEKKINTKNKIIIICSIDSEDYFPESNIKIIENKFNTFKSEIKLINISGHPFLNNLCQKINEIFIDSKEFKVENLNVQQLFNWESDFDYIKYINSLAIEKDKDKLLNLDIDKDDNLLNYILFIDFIEKMILSYTKNKSEKNINNLELIKKVMVINFLSGNHILINILKSFQKSIYNTIYRITDSFYKLPIDYLNNYLSQSYIKYILEFYEIIYPKIYKNNISSISHVNNKNLLKKNILKNINETSKILLKTLPNLNINDKSIEYLRSTLSLTNWNEEYNNLNPFGFLIKYNPGKFSYKGILDINSSIIKSYPNMIINSITTNWVGIYDYYQLILSDYEENSNDYSNINKEIFNIANFNITDNIQGDGNVLLPVYINQHHWELTKSIWSYHISFINNCFEPEYNKKMDNIYFLTFLKIFNNLKKNDSNTNTKSIIRLFCYLLRTCIQILIDNKFLHSIKKDYPKYVELVLETEQIEKNSNFSDWIIRLIQLIISNGCEEEQLDKELDMITKHIFNKFIIANYKMDFWEMINDSNTLPEKINIELDILKNHVLQDNVSWLFFNHDIKIINKIIKSIYSIKGFNQFIKSIDLSNGLVEDDNLNNLNNQINISVLSKIIEDKFAEQFDITKFNVDISKFYAKNF
jgi:hypothetical protein